MNFFLTAGSGKSPWAANNFLFFIDASSSMNLTDAEKDSLNRGEALVNSDPHTGKLLIRVNIKSFQKEMSVDKERSPDIENFRFDSLDFNQMKENEIGKNIADDDRHQFSNQRNNVDRERQAGNLILE